MKIKRNYPTKRNIQKIGKCYEDYLRIEVLRGNMPKTDSVFWIKINKKIKKDPGFEPFKFYARDFRKITKPIPYFS